VRGCLDCEWLSSIVLSATLSYMILNPAQQQHVDRVTAAGRTLAEAKRAARRATDDVKGAAYAALDAGVPLSRVAEAAEVERSLVYHWLNQEDAAA
jgi:hypothetical protein